MLNRRAGIAIFSVLATVAVIAAAGRFASWYFHPIRTELEDAPDLAVSQQQHEANGYGADSARVDSQVTFRIPIGQAAASTST